MVRNLVLVRLRSGTPPERVDELIAALRALRLPGMREMFVGRDAGLREGNADLAIVSDFDDEAAYRAYDADAEHNRIRRELVGPIADHVERCQVRT